MLIKPYNSIFTDTLDAYEQTYEGEVIDNNDPEKLKRVKVHIPIWDMYTDDQLQWVSPMGTIGASPNVDKHNIPEIGSKVTIVFNNKDPEDPRYTGASVTESTRCSLFDEDYPNTYGEKDSIGNFVMHNKNTGISVFHHNSGTEIQMDPDGSFMIQSGSSNTSVSIDNQGRVFIHASVINMAVTEEINMSADRVNIEGRNLLKLMGTVVDIKGDDSMELGAKYSKITGAQLTLEPKEVRVVEAFKVESAGSYVFDDLYGKTKLVFANGVLSSTEDMS